MIEAWSELPWWLRLIVALLIMGAGAAVFWWVSVKLGCAMFGLGFVLFMMGGQTRAEKNGYRF